MTTPETPRAESGPRYVRLQVELILEVVDEQKLSGAAVERIGADEFMPDEERVEAAASVEQDESEALAYLVDPFDLVSDVPGVDLIQASWSCSHTEYDPESDEWDLYSEDGGAEEEPGRT